MNLYYCFLWLCKSFLPTLKIMHAITMLLKFEHAEESPGWLVQTQIPVTHRTPDSVGLEWGWGESAFLATFQCCCCPGDQTLRSTALQGLWLEDSLLNPGLTITSNLFVISHQHVMVTLNMVTHTHSLSYSITQVHFDEQNQLPIAFAAYIYLL